MHSRREVRKTGKTDQHHHLAAIMFTDIQGYTALMQEDQEQAIEIRTEHRRIFKATTQKYHGEILQYYGDGTLSIFDSAIDAVKCGIEMQLDFPIPVRIGIHTGEVIHNEEEIIGDGVNIASRIESLSVVGSVFVSGKVYDDIKNQKSISTKLVGSFMLKNVKDPVDVYAISNDGLVVPFSEQIKGNVGERKEKKPKAKTVVDGYSRKFLLPGIVLSLLLAIIGYLAIKGGLGNNVEIDQSIAILPFANLSENEDQDYLSDGITEDLITHLSKIGDLNVISLTSTIWFKNTTKTTKQIAKELSVGHILTGSVRINGNRLRISAQLIDAKTDNYLWADTFDREVDDVFAIQSEVAMEVAKALQAELTKKEEDDVGTKPTDNTEAYERYLHGLYYLRSGSIDGLNKSYPSLLQAIRIDPEFAEAHSEIAMYYIRQGVWTGHLKPEVAREEALSYVMKALELDPDLESARIRLAIIKFLFEWDFVGAEKEFLRGKSTGDYGFFLLLMGRFEEAEQRFEESHQLNPMGRLDRPYRGLIQYFLGQPEKAIKIMQDGISLQPDVTDGYHNLGKTYLNVGNYNDAISTLEQGMLVGKDRIPTLLGDLGVAYYKSRQPEKAEDIINELKALDSDGHQGSPSFFLAEIYAGMGETELAFEWLNRSYAAHEVEMIWLNIEPQFESIRNDPRFIDLLENVGF